MVSCKNYNFVFQFGFFKRRTKEDMERLMKDNEDNNAQEAAMDTNGKCFVMLAKAVLLVLIGISHA